MNCPANHTDAPLDSPGRKQPSDQAINEKWSELCSQEGLSWPDKVRAMVRHFAPAAVHHPDTALLDFLGTEYLDLTCFAIPTGAGDADVGWRLTQERMGELQPEEIAVHWRDEPRKAIREAMAALGYVPPAEPAGEPASKLERVPQVFRAATDIAGHAVVEAFLPCINGLQAWVCVADLGKDEPSDEMFGGLDRDALARQIACGLNGEVGAALVCTEASLRPDAVRAALQDLRALVLRMRGNYPLPHSDGHAEMKAADAALAMLEYVRSELVQAPFRERAREVPGG
ncbi:hypothetical protein [Ramlibacter sp. AN1133]|uniref:hypothetical protein n=1 Tax=Ramlibacter sp. AN1133 TaxID=3133429 RepID=UPI0030C152B1